MATATAVVPLTLTGHPLQRCGARAVARLANVDDPGDVTPENLDEVAERLVKDIVRAAVAPKAAPAYDWWKVLFALYPNSKATHAKRPKAPAELAKEVARFFEPDDQPGADGARPCVFCGEPAAVLWAKDKLPMFDSMKAVNMLPPGLAGWPVCRGCRIAIWALPYGAWVTAGSATVLTCADDAVERKFARRNVRRARQVQHAGFTSLPPYASAETVALAALREHAATSPGAAGAGATLWSFQNNNRPEDAWLRSNATRGGIPAFLRRMLADPEARRGWGALTAVLTQKGKDGLVTVSGSAAAAKLLFDPADSPGGPPPDRLQRELLLMTQHPEKFPGAMLTAWQALCRLHLEVVHGMETGQLKPARELIVEWILAEKNPRGRFNDYVAAARWPGALQTLLMKANARLILDTGRAPDVSGVTEHLSALDSTAWRLRGQLYFDVLAELVAREAPIARKPKPGEDQADQDVDLDSALDPPVTEDETYDDEGWG